MHRRNTNKNTYRVTTSRAAYAVTLESIRNSASGTPRFTANILVLDVFGEQMSGSFIYTPSYTFTGHYSADEEEAAYIVGVYESEI